jgi:hydrogenase maturation protease
VTGRTEDFPAPVGAILVACFGNVLRGDDGFGSAVAACLLSSPLPPDVTVMDVGIGGVHLVQELMHAPVGLLVVVDAVDLGLEAGQVVVQRPDVADPADHADRVRSDELADMHVATPERALRLARGLGVLPADVLVVGVQTTDTRRVGEGLSPVTSEAVRTAADEVRRIVSGGTRPRSGR